MTGIVLLITDATGEVWLATPEEFRADAADPNGRTQRGNFPAKYLTVHEVTGSAE